MTPVTPDLPKFGARNTKQRAAVIDVLLDLDTFSSAKTIHDELEERGHKVGLTTVYRTLQGLADVEAVDVLTMSSGQTLYRHCITDDHHHHLVCSRCGKTEEIDGGPVEAWARSVADAHGYTLTGHDAEIYGLCPACQGTDRGEDK
ncbi:Fur family transcriptional regulator [Corynebacterium uberis]|uniref:Fur family transcriptional regulator n=1 Tax=Corynebacterium TaxID=1716 RepID=UPI001D0B95FD|nr:MULTISPECIES: Fur family transcriptional regulator [Corynebacterium]MCZ9308212.1 transcriptional repressor [Corynebacterium sp. c6VSa_13]UDL73893.1 transcriptional repressor [Corynebacterium uberis]UDL75224.1 transcriptional repressor [Corynebacterium uberis]UDL77435.1 transcriptional repressor [Corynebacterium uberis]UDL79721.1 transcriptional repressor [Corynebacterium uberis]